MTVSTTSVGRDAGLMGLLRRYPLLGYFVIAYGFTWTYILVFLVGLGVPLVGLTNVPVILGPTVGAFIMTFAVEGKPGILHLLYRYVLWRVGVIWYLFALLAPPILFNLGLAVLPGALPTFTLPTGETLQGLPVFFILVLVIGGPLLEEPGWRGFALPRMQERWTPWLATLILGVLWAAWHYPLFLLPVWAAQNGGATPVTVGIYTVTVIGMTYLFTWLFNHAKGSLLLVILFHTSINILGALTLFGGDPILGGLIAIVIAALVIVVLTRGRLGYDVYLRDKEQGLT